VYVVIDANDLDDVPGGEGVQWSVIDGCDAILHNALAARYGSPVTLSSLLSVVFDNKAINPKLLDKVTPNGRI
jgi:hypothetical protein